jgi:uncharacterized membrane protein YphA (DoxX/SURF4 family)
MENCQTNIFMLEIVASFAAGFLAITFLQSGLDKIFDYKGNLSFMKEQFSKTFLKNTIGFLLPVILVFELVTGLLCVLGIIQVFRGEGRQMLVYGFLLSGITLLMLLFGQRVSKQYPGAVSLTGYFIITLIGLMMCVTFSWCATR